MFVFNAATIAMSYIISYFNMVTIVNSISLSLCVCACLCVFTKTDSALIYFLH